MTRAEAQVVRAALAWWRGLRPVGWTQKKHLCFPCVNCNFRASEPALAEAVRTLLTTKRRTAR